MFSLIDFWKQHMGFDYPPKCQTVVRTFDTISCRRKNRGPSVIRPCTMFVSPAFHTVRRSALVLCTCILRWVPFARHRCPYSRRWSDEDCRESVELGCQGRGVCPSPLCSVFRSDTSGRDGSRKKALPQKSYFPRDTY